jgi:hypothetical protein
LPGDQVGDEMVLGSVSIQSGDFGPASASPQPVPWRYWQKRGLFIKAGAPPLTISVPTSWHNRVAFTWGVGNGPVTGSLRLTTCAQPSGVWDAYAGGFYLRTPSACVPLVFRIGSRSVTVHFSIGHSCGLTSPSAPTPSRPPSRPNDHSSHTGNSMPILGGSRCVFKRTNGANGTHCGPDSRLLATPMAPLARLTSPGRRPAAGAGGRSGAAFAQGSEDCSGLAMLSA